MRITSLIVTMTIVTTMTVVSASPSYAQCCSAGSPIGGTGNLGIMSDDQSKMIVGYRFTSSDQTYYGSRPDEPIFLDSVFLQQLQLNFTYGITDRLTVEAEAGAFHSLLRGPAILPSRELNVGISDASVLAQYNLYRDRQRRGELTLGAGIKYPTGALKQTYRGAFASVTEDPVTRTPDLVQTAFLYRRFPARGLQFFLTNRIEFRGSDTDGYRYGNLYATSFFVSYNLGLRWNVLLQARNEIRERDVRRSQGLAFTGSHKVFLVPQVSYTLTPAIDVTALVDVPVYQHYNERQLGSEMSPGIALIYRLKANALDEVQLDPAPGK